MITADKVAGLSDADIMRLIFEEGFSTQEKVTDVSGRGVGLDAVKSSVQKLGGVVDAQSEEGRGTTITIHIPLTLAIVPALIVGVEQSHFAIPQINIDEVVWLYGEDIYRKIERVNDNEVYRLRGKLLPILRLSSILEMRESYKNPATGHRSPDRRQQESMDKLTPLEQPAVHVPRRRHSKENSIYIIVIQLGKESFGLVVDTIIDTEEIVAKPLHGKLERCKVYSGTAVLGDGRIAMILDMAGVAEKGNLRSHLETNHGLMSKESRRGSIEEKQGILLFNLGGEETFSIPLAIIKRVEKIPREKIKLVNNKPFMAIRETLTPLIRLDDSIENLYSNYGSTVYVIIPKFTREVGVMAAEIVDNIDAHPQIDSSTIMHSGIAGSSIIDGRIVLFLDICSLVEQRESDRGPGKLGLDHDRRREAPWILLAEDSSLHSLLITSYIRSQGYMVQTACNGREALEYLSSDPERYQWLISDLEMPEMDGLTLAREVRKLKCPNLKGLIAVSACDPELLEYTPQAAGFDYFAAKGDQSQLFAFLGKILSRENGEASQAIRENSANV